MKYLWSLALQLLLLLLLIRRDRNDGEHQLFRNQRWKPKHVLFLILSINFIIVLSAYLLRYGFVMDTFRRVPSIFHLFHLVALLAILKYGVRQDVQVFGLNTTKKQAFIAIAIALGLQTASLVLLYIPGRLESSIPEVARAMWRFRFTWFYIPILLQLVILAPIIEETIFRGFLFSPYRKKYGFWMAVLITSLFFCAFHPLRLFGSKFVFGIFVGILYEKTQSIIPPIVAHSTFNLIVFFTPFLQECLT